MIKLHVLKSEPTTRSNGNAAVVQDARSGMWRGTKTNSTLPVFLSNGENAPSHPHDHEADDWHIWLWLCGIRTAVIFLYLRIEPWTYHHDDSCIQQTRT